MKMMLARLLDKLPWTCWAALCCWAMGFESFPLWHGLTGCRDEPRGTDKCYCGKRCKFSKSEPRDWSEVF